MGFQTVSYTHLDVYKRQMMERLCSDKNHPDLYVPTFKNNYSQMKIDGPKSHLTET